MITEEKLGLLWPQPQSIIQRDGKPFTLGSQLPVYISTGPNESKNNGKITTVSSVFIDFVVDLILKMKCLGGGGGGGE